MMMMIVTTESHKAKFLLALVEQSTGSLEFKIATNSLSPIYPSRAVDSGSPRWPPPRPQPGAE
eukprot:scaffold156216_cov30-Prasinocladus_malaysianus.AAC.1